MFFNTINKIKSGYHNNKLYSKIKLNKNELKIIQFFVKLGVIKKIIIKDNFYYIFYSFIRNKKKFLIINMYKPSKKKFIKLNILKKLVLKKNWFLLMSTNKGIISSVEAVKLKVGGLIIAKLWN